MRAQSAYRARWPALPYINRLYGSRVWDFSLVAKIYLASASPRRQDLLHQLGIEFDVVLPEVSELRQHGESPAEYVRRVATEKARQGFAMIERRRSPSRPVLGADTCVVLDGEILGKPDNRRQAQAMLRRLSGRAHLVLTAVAVVYGAVEHSALNTSHVVFRPVTDSEIAQYWGTGEPVDKAGAYAIQGQAAAFVSRIEGSYSGVVGLPLYEAAQLLKEIGLDVL